MDRSDSLVSSIFGDNDLGSREATCEIHGAYVSAGVRWGKREAWAPCPVCAKADDERKRLAEQEAHARERAEIRLRHSYGRACIPPRFLNKTFDSYVADSDQKARALTICRDYAEKFEANEDSGPSLILCGRPGTGKTHLACSIADYLIQRGRTAVFSRVFDAIRTIKATWSRDSDITETQAIRSFIEPDLLILDEVGVQFGSEAEMLLLFEIINGRYEAIRPTILISNLPVTELKNFIGERVMDRLREGGGKYIAFDWESFRAQA